MNSSTIVIDLHAQQFHIETGKVSEILSDLKDGIDNFASSVFGSISSVIEKIFKLPDTLDNKNSVDSESSSVLPSDLILDTLDRISNTLDNICEKIGKKDFMDVTSWIVGVGSDLHNDYEKFRPKGKYESGEISWSLSLKPGKYEAKKESGIFAGLLGSILAPFGIGNSSKSSTGNGSPAKASAGNSSSSSTSLVDVGASLLNGLSGSNTSGVGIDATEVGKAAEVASTAIAELTEKLKTNTAATWLQNAATTTWNGVSSLATTVTTMFGSVMTFLTSPIGLVVIGITALIAIIVLLIANWDAVCTKAKEVWTAIQEKLSAFDEFLKNIFAKDFTEQFGAFGAVLNVFFDSVEGVWNAIKKVFGGIVDFVKNVFAGNWSAAWDSIVQIFTGIWEGIVGYFKPPLNAIIGFINGLISAIVNAVNFVIRAVNKLSIDIPNWDIFGSLAGKTFGLNIPLVSGCEIPYLAKGAVLPANRPFMAIVGDQRHGTNVEAPLATIQEAVAVVMEDQTAAIVAGFNASIGVQRELLSAVLGIRIGDEVIGRAADRYFAKRAAMGGY